MSAPGIVLASTSRYRAELLHRVLPDFERLPPGIEEAAQPDEAPQACAVRLAAAKARAVAARCADALVIGSDQVAELDGAALGKPGSEANARAQLAACAGREVRFHTALCVIDTRGAQAREHAALDLTRVRFRALDAAEIARYVAREQPLDAAGSFKCEGLGIALFERIDSEDPTALIGLPLIALCRILRTAGIALP